MKMRCEDFLGSLAAISVGVRATHQEVLDEWSPEEPPVTTLFAALGDRIAEDFDNADGNTNRQVFSLIEEAMEGGDSGLVTAVATGLIEALVTRTARDEGLWKRMTPFLGTKSLHHAEAWLTS